MALVPHRLEGRVAIVTGAGHGIGRAYARRLAEEGARAVVADQDAAAGEETADWLCRTGLTAMAIPTDVASAGSVESMAEQVLGQWGRIDILINNAAIFATIPMSRAPFDEITENEWDAMMRVNVKGMWLACRAVTPAMRNQRYGKIVNISSGTAFNGSATRIHYVTSKAAVLGFTRTLARELGPSGICVNCVAPGNTLSEEKPGEEVLAFRAAGAAGRALQRMERPADLVGAVAFFASPDSDFVTGRPWSSTAALSCTEHSVRRAAGETINPIAIGMTLCHTLVGCAISAAVRNSVVLPRKRGAQGRPR